MYQIPFNIPSPPNFAEEDFIIAECNHNAYNFIKQWPNWGEHRFGRILYLYGGHGCGKTHLAHIWRKYSQAQFLSAPTLGNDACYILENIEEHLVDEAQLFHFLNHIIDHKQYLLITSNIHPDQLKVRLVDLRSRLNAIYALEITMPDEELLSKVLIKQFSDRQMQVNLPVIQYITKHIERSFYAVDNLVERLDHASLAQKRHVTIPLVKLCLAD
jgi:chromosomal replication initiation ATPase DnaA